MLNKRKQQETACYSWMCAALPARYRYRTRTRTRYAISTVREYRSACVLMAASQLDHTTRHQWGQHLP